MTYLNHLSEPERIAELERLFRGVFSTPEGKIVFTAILEHLGHFDQATNDEGRILRNVANWLSGMVLSGDSFALVEAMLNVQKTAVIADRSVENGRNAGD